MSGTFKHVINMANSIIGVSILSMPYCFKEAGILLGVILILLSGFITKKTCMFLIRAAIMSRRRSYELLAFQVFGVTGKLLMELCMILFLIGICISFHVVMGDLAPAVVAKYMLIENSPSLRCTLLVGLVLLVILPLCLLRNLDSLASMSAFSIGFYIFVNCMIFYMALPNLLDGSWFFKAKLFHFDSAFRILPIMTLALSCQSNVFEIYDSIPDPDVVKMKNVVSQAVNICCGLYIGVGFLGYVAFIETDVTGNIILMFPVSKLTDCVNVFFVFSLAISFPLMLFPCRTSIHSLCYKRNTQISYDLVGNYMPETRFKGITFCVLISSLVIGILLPNIEFVLGLLGSTMGVTIALILPSVFYIKVYTKTSCDRLLAQGFFLFGIFIMVTGTYLHLNGLQTTGGPVTMSPDIKQIEELPKDLPLKDIPEVPAIVPQIEEKLAPDLTGRKEPAIPEPPNSDQEGVEKKQAVDPIAPAVAVDEKSDAGVKKTEKDSESKKVDDEAKIVKKDVKEEDKIGFEKMEGKEEVLHPDAIRKEEKENLEESLVVGKANIEDKQEQILKQMEHQQKEQKKLIEEQKKILQELKDQKEKIEEVAKPEKKMKGDETRNRKDESKQLPQRSVENEAKVLLNVSANELPGNLHQNAIVPPKLEKNSPPELIDISPKRSEQNLPLGVILPKQSDILPLKEENMQQKLVENLPVKIEDDVFQQPIKNLPINVDENIPKKSAKILPIKIEDIPPKPAKNLPIRIEENIPQKPVVVVNMPQKVEVNIPKQIKENLPQKPFFIDQPQNIGISDGLNQKDSFSNRLSNNIQKIDSVNGVHNDVNVPHQSDTVVESPQNIFEKDTKKQTKKLINVDAGKDQSNIPKPEIDSKPLKIDKTLPKANRVAEILENKVLDGAKSLDIPRDKISEDALKHDEERRKRDTAFVESKEESVIPKAIIQESDRLSFGANLEQSKTLASDHKIADALFESRHLLWLKRGRRKKRRNEQFPEYWDEI